MGEKKFERTLVSEIECDLSIKKPGGTYYTTSIIVGKKETLNGQFTLEKTRFEASQLIRKVWEKVQSDLNDLILKEDELAAKAEEVKE